MGLADCRSQVGDFPRAAPKLWTEIGWLLEGRQIYSTGSERLRPTRGQAAGKETWMKDKKRMHVEGGREQCQQNWSERDVERLAFQFLIS